MSELNDPLAFFDGDVKAPVSAPVSAPADLGSGAEAAAGTALVPAVPAVPAAEVPAASDDAFPGAPAGYVPVRALQDERQKRRTLEEVVGGFQKPASAAPQAPAPVQQPTVQRPIPMAGTPEHAAYIQDQLFQQQVSSKFDRSEMMATLTHSAEVVNAAKAWAEQKQDPMWWMSVIDSPDPYGRVIQEMNNEKAATEWTSNQTDWQAFQAWKAAQATGAASTPAGQVPTPPNVVAPSVAAAQQTAQAAKTSSTPPVSRGSILSTPAANGTKPGEVATGNGEAFGGLFQK